MTRQTLVERLRELHKRTDAEGDMADLAVHNELTDILDALTGQEGAAPSPQSTDEKNTGLLGTAAGKSGDGPTPVAATRYVVGGYSGNQIGPLVEAMLRDADASPDGREPLREIVRALSTRLKPECPCGLHAEQWHIYGVCAEGATRL
jgi:hypothetical protein